THVAGGAPEPRKNEPLRTGASVSKLRFAFVVFVCSIPTKNVPGPTATGAGSVIVTGPAAPTLRSAASTYSRLPGVPTPAALKIAMRWSVARAGKTWGTPCVPCGAAPAENFATMVPTTPSPNPPDAVDPTYL